MKQKNKLYLILAFSVVLAIEIYSLISMSKSDNSWYKHQIGDILSTAMFEETLSRIPVTSISENDLSEILEEIEEDGARPISAAKIEYRTSLAKRLNSHYSSAEDIDISAFDHVLTEAFNYEEFNTNYHFELKERDGETTRTVASVYHDTRWCPFEYEHFNIPVNSDGSVYYDFSICICRLVILWELPRAGMILVGNLILALLIAMVLIYEKKQKHLEKAKMEFANRIVHDLRNPLSVAFMSTELLEMHCEDSEDKEMKELSGYIHKHLVTVDEKIEELLVLIRGKKKNNGNTQNTGN